MVAPFTDPCHVIWGRPSCATAQTPATSAAMADNFIASFIVLGGARAQHYTDFMGPSETCLHTLAFNRQRGVQRCFRSNMPFFPCCSPWPRCRPAVTTITRIELVRLRPRKLSARWDMRPVPATSGRTDTGIFADRAGCGPTGIVPGRLIRALSGYGHTGRIMGGL